MAKKAKQRFSGYFPISIIEAIKAKAVADEIAENEAAQYFLELGIKADQQQTPAGLTGIDLSIWKAEQKAKQKA
jgi:hypothetical protein